MHGNSRLGNIAAIVIIFIFNVIKSNGKPLKKCLKL